MARSSLPCLAGMATGYPGAMEHEEESQPLSEDELEPLHKAAEDPTGPADGDAQPDDQPAESEEPVQGQQPG